MILYCKYCKKYYHKTGLLQCPKGSKNFHVLIHKIPRKNLSAPKLSDFLPTSNPFLYFKSYLSNANEKTILSVDKGLKKISEPPFRITPLLDAKKLTEELGLLPNTLFVKDETHNVAGSHKGRHAMGNLLYIETFAKKKNLAIYSCGNAALGAAAVSKALGYNLFTFVPTEVSPEIVKRLVFYGAHVIKVPREGNIEGDPCYLRFKGAIDKLNLLPCSCSGPDNWPNIEGGATIFYEMAYQIKQLGCELDTIIVQVGGGALASAVIYAMEMLKKTDLLKRRPKLICVQTQGCYPLLRAYEKVKNVKLQYPEWTLNEIMQLAASRSNEIMWAWDKNIPESLAEGILDDVTYDWLAVVEGILKTRGEVIVVEEELIVAAYTMAKRLGINVSATGTAGLAGLMHLLKAGKVKKGEKIGLLFTGIDKGSKVEVGQDLIRKNSLTLYKRDPIESIFDYKEG